MSSIIFQNCAVYTANQDRPRAEAVVVEGNRILFVGSNAEAESMRKPNTVLIDGQGQTLMPGIHDSHFHLYMGSMGINDLRFESVNSLAELREVLRRRAFDQPDVEWIQGGGLAYDIIGENEPLTRHHLDEILPNRPVLISSLDMHTSWANTIALERAGILHGGEVSAPAEIVLDENGLATGQLNEAQAKEPVRALIPDPTRQQELDLLRQGLARMAGYGITSVTNMFGDAHQFDLYQQLLANGELTARVTVPFHFTPEMDIQLIADEAVPLSRQYTGEKLRGGSFKLFMDGVIESYTSLLIEPYTNRPDTYGEAIYSAERFNAIVAEADRHGLQIFVHAIGDGSIRRTLDGFEYARAQNGVRDSRHRIEHVELLHDEDLPRFKELGIIAAMQPLHASRPEAGHYLNWMSCVGGERYHASFRWVDLMNQGTPIPLGSDWPVVTMDPFISMDAAVNRLAWRDDLTRHAFHVDEMLDGYTRVPAYAEFTEGIKGQIKPGMLADLVLLSENIFDIPTEKIRDLKAQLTVCDGEIVHDGR